jgi:hypothetical protein
MKIVDFTDLTLSDQVELLYRDGVFLAKIKQGNTYVILYQIEKMYVEIFYIRYRSVVSHIKCSESTEILQPYLEQIRLEEFLET